MVGTSEQTAEMGFIQKLNGPWHERALWIYLAIVVLHWIEHLFQAAQIWILEMPRPEALGARVMSSRGWSSPRSCTSDTP